MPPVVNPELGKMPYSPKHYFNTLIRDNSWVNNKHPLRKRLIDINRTNLTYELDVAMWYGAFITAEGLLGQFFKRMFGTIYYGGLMYRSKNGNWKLWPDTGTPLASTISHGGRILIQLPNSKVKGASKFWDWMLSGIKVNAGGLATHGVKKESKPYEHIYGDRFKYLKETHGKVVAVKHIGHHKRFDIALGGNGYTNPWSGNKISANGEHGHLYMYYSKPTSANYGAIMLSLESEAPGKTGQTGHAHSASAASEEFTATGGAKWVLKPEDAKKGFMQLKDSDLRDRYDGLLIDLTGGGTDRDMNFVMKSADNLKIDALAMAPCPPVTLSVKKTLIPEPDIWKHSTKGSQTRSSAGLIELDAMIGGYHTFLETGFSDAQDAYLDDMKDACTRWVLGYGRRFKKRKPGVERLKGLVSEELKVYKKRKAMDFSPPLKSSKPALAVDSSKLFKNNRVNFLLDGEEYFSEFSDCSKFLIGCVKKRRNDFELNRKYIPDRTYVRMAYWKFDKNRTSAFMDIQSLFRNGIDVDIILYYPTETEQKIGGQEPTEIAKSNLETAEALVRACSQSHLRNTTQNKRIGNVRVFLEKYEGWSGASNHQKIAIFYFEGNRICLVGGLNIASYYKDNVEHNLLIGNGEGYSFKENHKFNYGWHDTGLRIQGPATAEIEKEWMRRWHRAIALEKSSAISKSPNKYLVKRENDRPFSQIPVNTKVQNEYPAKIQKKGLVSGVDIQIAITRTEKTIRINQIKEEFVKNISKATRYIYIENYGLSDPDIVKALYERVAQIPDLTIIVVTAANHKRKCGLDGRPLDRENDQPFGCLNRRAWLHIALRQKKSDGMWVEYETGNNSADKIRAERWDNIIDCAPNGSAYTSLTANISNRWLSNDKVTLHTGKAKKNIKFQDITNVNTGLYFYTPIIFRGWGKNEPFFNTIEIHSKLAIIDDILIVGSSNWTYRSMNYDGEIAAICHNGNLAKLALERLLSHYDYKKKKTTKSFMKSADENVSDLLEERAHKGTHDVKNKLMIIPIEHPQFPWIRFQRTAPNIPILNHTWF